jgi:hypothetical protein
MVPPAVLVAQTKLLHLAVPAAVVVPVSEEVAALAAVLEPL